MPIGSCHAAVTNRRWPIAVALFFIFSLTENSLAQSVLNVPAAFPTIQTAIAAAGSGDTVLCAPGTYAETIDFLGKTITVLGAGPGASTLDGGGTAVTVALASGTVGAKLTGFTVTGFDGGSGYGVRLANAADISVTECDIVGTGAGATGAFVFANCDLIMEDVTVSGCTTGIEIQGQATVQDSIVTGNETGVFVRTGVFGVGGGPATIRRTQIIGNVGGSGVVVRDTGLAVSFIDCDISDNEGPTGAGARIELCCSSTAGPPVPLFERCTFERNVATGNGGAVRCLSGFPTFRDCRFVHNAANHGGAISAGTQLIVPSETVFLEGCDVVDNTASGNGGGFHVDLVPFPTFPHTLALTNVVVAGNHADGSGGGIYRSEGEVYVTRSTVSANTAGSGADGIHTLSEGGLFSTNHIVSSGSIVWGNGDVDVGGGGSWQAIYTVIGNAVMSLIGNGNTTGDPLLVHAKLGYVQLLPGSSALDTGSPLGPPDPDGSPADIGARRFPVRVPADHGTIQAAIDASMDGDAVFVDPGTWSECLDFGGRDILVYGTGGADVTKVAGACTNVPVVRFDSGETRLALLKQVLITGGLRTAGGVGAGVQCIDASPSIIDCIVEGNVCLGGADGAGIALVRSDSTIEGCLVVNNSADNGWGTGIYTCDGSPEIVGCRIVNNNATGNFSFGGGIHVNSNSSHIERCIVAGNTAGAGGGINVAPGATAVVSHATVADNTATSASAFAGGGLRMIAGTLLADHNIVFGNTPFEISVFGAAPIQVEWSDVGGGYPGLGNIALDPRFRDATNLDYRLRGDSPCIDAGDPSAPFDDDGTVADLGALPDLGLRLGDCGAPTLGDGHFTGAPFSTLDVNGSTGGATRRVDLDLGESLTVHLANPPGVTPAMPFVIFAYLGIPGPQHETVLPFGIGTLCIPDCHLTPIPGALVLANSFGPDPCGTLLPSVPGDFTFTDPDGLPLPFTFALQGVQAPGPGLTPQTTNAVLVRVRN